MKTTNETVADIVEEMREYAKRSEVNGGDVDVWNWLADFADRIEAAHKRDLDNYISMHGIHVEEAIDDANIKKIDALNAENAKLRDAIDRIYKCVDNKHGVDVTSLVKAIIADTLEESK